MKNIITATLLLLVLVACQNSKELSPNISDNNFTITVAANEASSSRIGVDTDTWEVSWSDGDALVAWGVEGDCTTTLTMSVYDAEASTFEGTVENSDNLRLLYSTQTTPTIVDGFYTADFSTQKAGLTTTEMVSSAVVEVINPISTSMKHIGAAMKVVVTYLYIDSEKSYSLNSLELCDVPTVVAIDLSKDVSHADFYTEQTVSNIVVSEINGAEAVVGESSICYFNILPFSLGAQQSVDVILHFDVVDSEQNSTTESITATVTNTTESEISLVRATQNTINISCRCIEDEVTISGATILDWIDDGTTEVIDMEKA